MYFVRFRGFIRGGMFWAWWMGAYAALTAKHQLLAPQAGQHNNRPSYQVLFFCFFGNYINRLSQSVQKSGASLL